MPGRRSRDCRGYQEGNVGNLRFREWLENRSEGSIVSGLAIVVGAVAVDDDSGKGLLLLQEIGNHGAKILRHASTLARAQFGIGGNVSVGEQGPGLACRFLGSGRSGGSKAQNRGIPEKSSTGLGGKVDRHFAILWDSSRNGKKEACLF